MSPKNPHGQSNHFTFNAMLSVATSDWTDKDKTMEIAKKIREAGIEGTLKYKPGVGVIKLSFVVTSDGTE